MANTYFEMLQAVENYYGAGSDQWVTMANWTGYQSAEITGILKQVPGISVYTNEAGEMVSYAINGSFNSLTAGEAAANAAAGAINSNVAAGSTITEAITIPGNAATVEAGKVAITSGATKVATGTTLQTVLGHAATWLIGAGIGMKLGVWIDGALYNANPDFWDKHNMQTLNPETWKAHEITNWLYDNSGYDDFVTMFDTDGNLYVDQDLFAVAAQYLASQGAFESGTTIDDDVDPNDLYAAYDEINFSVATSLKAYKASDPTKYIEYSVTAQQSRTYGAFVKCTNPITGLNQDWLMFGSNDPFEVTYVNTPFSTSGTVTSTQMTAKNGDPIYFVGYQFGGLDLNIKTPIEVIYTITAQQGATVDNIKADIAYMLANGTLHENGVPGINQYDTVPTGITDNMTPQQILDLLRQQYPGLFDDAIKQGIVNDDGTVTDKYYLPIAIPTGGDEGKPTTDPDHPGAVDPTNEPQTQYITKVIRVAPDPTPPGQDDPPTGGGKAPVPVLPTGSADALYKIYNPTNAQIQSFGAWLWSSNFVDQLLKVFNDPMQAIISLHKIYATPHTGGTTTIKVGYLDSNVQSKYVDQQYITVDCGSVNLLETRGNVLDYDPYTSVKIYLPFIGIVELSTADVMRSSIGVKYNIDVLTGTVVAMVSVARDGGNGGIIYQYTGSCAECYPLSSGSFMGIITGILGIAAGVAGTIASGGAAAPALIGGAAGLTAMHTKVEHSNGFSGNAGAMAAKKPYLIISRQQSAMANGIGDTTGWPANYYCKLSQCSGLTRVRNTVLNIPGATDAELNEVEGLLKSGVII